MSPTALAEVERATAEEARRHPAAYPQVLVTSSESGQGMEMLREAVIEAAL